MEFFDLIQKRYSVRAYRPDAVADEALEKVLAAACIAPTAANRQPLQFVVIHTSGREQEVQRLYHRDWFAQAPIVIVACGLPGQGWVRDVDQANYTMVDVAIAMDHLILAAADLGLGTCWIADFDPLVVREVLNLPEGVEPIVMTPLGYPADQSKPKQRKALAELVRYERW
jgi:nitroreductase